MSTDQCLTQEIQYEVVRSARATRPRIDIRLGDIKVVIPEGSGLNPAELVEEKRDWIEKKWTKLEKQREQIPERKFEAGATWPYLGEAHRIVVGASKSRKVEEFEEETSQTGKPGIILNQDRVEKHSIKDELEDFYREAAREHMTDLVKQWAETLNVSYDTIYIRNQRTKWASCSSKSNLNFNFRLMMAPPEIVEYIVVHELCHLIQPNHGPKFNQLLNRHAPNHQAHEQWLEDSSMKLIFTRSDL